MSGGRPFKALRKFWRGSGGRTPWLRRIFLVLFFFIVPAPIVLLLVFRFMPIPGTPEMLFNLITLNETHYSWACDDISPSLGQAVIGSEDQQ
ncbi:MAG TPA: hypothetical protein VG309_10395, partial [Rhizomicrobium sp.]|nr:hypothetical protein [Rhizomicrobium sp.]